MNDEKIQFREKALEHASQPAKLDESLQVISPKGWMMLAISLLILIAFFCWLIFGKIEIQVDGNGILLSTSDAIVSVAAPAESGTVENIHAAVGQVIKNHDLLLTLTDPLLLKEISEKATYLNQLLQQKQQLTTRQTEAVAQQKQLLEATVVKLEQSLEKAKAKLAESEKLMKLKEAAFSKGLEIVSEVTQAKINYYHSQQEVRNYEINLIQTKANIHQFIDTWNERQRQIDDEINKAKENLAQLKNQWEVMQKIYSPISGTISEIMIKNHDVVKKDQLLINIIPDNQDLYALIFVPASMGKKVKMSMQAHINPSGVRKLEFGSIKGKVENVSQFPVTYSYILATLKNPDLAKMYVSQGPVFAVKIDLNKNKNTMSGYQWTTSKGPDINLSQGTPVAAKIAVKKTSPMRLFLSITKNLL